jgi:hypothetical protein
LLFLPALYALWFRKNLDVGATDGAAEATAACEPELAVLGEPVYSQIRLAAE